MNIGSSPVLYLLLVIESCDQLKDSIFLLSQAFSVPYGRYLKVSIPMHLFYSPKPLTVHLICIRSAPDPYCQIPGSALTVHTRQRLRLLYLINVSSACKFHEVLSQSRCTRYALTMKFQLTHCHEYPSLHLVMLSRCTHCTHGMHCHVSRGMEYTPSLPSDSLWGPNSLLVRALIILSSLPAVCHSRTWGTAWGMTGIDVIDV